MVKASEIPLEIVLEERIRGSKLMVHFRWVFIALLVLLLAMQYFTGYKSESLHAILLIGFYALCNILIAAGLKRNYDPAWSRYGGAAIDTGIIAFHLFYLANSFDQIAVTAAATTFLYPVMILLYTFRLDQRLLVFITLFSIFSFNIVYFYHYFGNPDAFQVSLSLSPSSHIFKSSYLLFIGFLCIYLQHSLKRLIIKQMNESRRNLDAEIELSLAQQKNAHTEELIRQEKELNKQLAREIFERKEAETALAQSREQLHSIISNQLGVTYRCNNDANWSMQFISHQIEKISGYPASDIIGNSKMSYMDIIHPDDREDVVRQVNNGISMKMPFEVIYRITHASGKTVWVQENGRGIFDKDEKLLWIDGVIIDINEKMETEKAYHESEIRFHELTDFLPQTIYELDLAGNIVFVNRAGVELFGEGVRKPDGKVSALQFFIPEDKERMVSNLRDKLQGKGKLFNEYTAICADGRHCPVIIYSSPIIRDGKVTGFRGIIVEISELKRVEEDLRYAKEELETLNMNLEKAVDQRTAELTEANTQLLRLQKENLQSQFDVLKQQVNPHFLFNSLNVLISLIKLEPNLAETFTERLAKVYRYVLENRDENLVPVKTEMDFLRAYVFLIDTRFQGKVIIKIEFDEEKENRLILPLSLQLLIENAIKHNVFSTKSPLTIRLFIDDNGYLNVVNNLQVREKHIASTGIGLNNISSRYSLICDKAPVFEQSQHEFIAKIPLLHA
ncbi:MAG: PAS domain-containing protein [Bacteroidales bacterium]|nr:PAS domain-containing protein [Bacteroidales bacterium]